MIAVLRVLFAVCALVFFYIGGLLFARLVYKRIENRYHPLYFAYFVNALLLAVFFTLWGVKQGLV